LYKDAVVCCKYPTQQKVETVVELNRVWGWWRVFTRFGR